MAQILNRDNKMTKYVWKWTYQLVPELLSLLEEMWSFPCQLGEALCFPVVLKATKKEKRKRRSGRHLTIPREGAVPAENSADIKNVSCSYFCKAMRGLGFPFPAARTLMIALQFQSDISISPQTDPSLQGPPLGIKQLRRQQKGCDVTNKTTA